MNKTILVPVCGVCGSAAASIKAMAEVDRVGKGVKLLALYEHGHQCRDCNKQCQLDWVKNPSSGLSDSQWLTEQGGFNGVFFTPAVTAVLDQMLRQEVITRLFVSLGHIAVYTESAAREDNAYGLPLNSDVDGERCYLIQL